ncbi:MAG: hypothetical protein AAF517_14660 [Planctomycetota bacterium]
MLFESAHVRPLTLVSSNGDTFLAAVNTPDQRVEFFRPIASGLESVGECRVGLEPVAVAARNSSQVFIVNHLSDSVSVVDASDPSRPYVSGTLLVGDEPRDLVVAGPDRRFLFVCAARRGQHRPGGSSPGESGIGRADIWVFDANHLDSPPSLVTPFCDTPRALAVSSDGTSVFVAAFRSGNRSTVLNERSVNPFWTRLIDDGFVALGLPPPTRSADGERGPDTGLIVQFDGKRWVDGEGRDWSPRLRFDLPDRDVFEIDATSSPPKVTASFSGVGTTIFGLAVHPVTQAFYASQLEARNLVRHEENLRGRFVDAGLSIAGGEQNEEQRTLALNGNGRPKFSLPIALVFNDTGDELYLAEFSSNFVAILTPSGEITGTIQTGAGPSGLVHDAKAKRLYVMNRFDQSISTIELETRDSIAATPLRFDPEPEPLRNGRRLFYDAEASSSNGQLSCVLVPGQWFARPYSRR